MTGVQIVKSMPRYYEVQLVEGVEPLRIPRNQVLSVEFDDYDPSRERLRRELFPDSEEVSLASGERVSRHLMDKLMAPVSEDSLSYDKKDLIRVLEETADRLDVKIKIHPSIRNTPANRRRWTIETTEGTTLMTLLREDLVSEFDFVEVLFENDTVVVMTKKAATSRKTKVEGSGE